MSENPDKVKYLSQEWIEAVEKRIKATLTPEDVKNISSSMKNMYKNCPDGKTHYYYLAFENGLVSEALVGTDKDEVASKKAEFTIIGDYEIFAQITRGEMGARSALMRNKIKLKGNMVKALRLASVVDRINKLVAEIPTEY